ncbi:alpha/beta hydrolase family protein [uncultured Oscillibacter sp.]|uniref:alpha/beta hydrolase n=1 Tax=uncultured Oscillibacter sp. TaxID=876091 RepID=UPI0025E23DDE|nr:alpha/beta hydrolase family protein [uncultured Oscillibacter sp.]
MKQSLIQIPSARLACEVYGEGNISLVVEMGLGTVTAEWRQLAERLARRRTVLLYQRAGYGASSSSDLPRTPGNIALELRHLLDRLPHAEKLTLLAHSQGVPGADRQARPAGPPLPAGLPLPRGADGDGVSEKRRGRDRRTGVEPEADADASGLAGKADDVRRAAVLLQQLSRRRPDGDPRVEGRRRGPPR